MSYGDPRVLYRLFDLSYRDEPIPTSYVGVLIQAERGPMWEGIPISAQDAEKFIETFGNSVDWTQDPLCCIKALESGANLVVHRIGHCTDVSDRTTLDILSASVLIPDRGGQPTPGAIESDAGPFTFTEALSGRATGTEIGPYTINTGANDAFKVRVGTPGNWGAEETVTLTAGTRTAQEICDDINAQTSGLNATVSTDNKIYLEAILVGNDLEIMAVANDAYSALGFSEAVYNHVDGTDYLVIAVDGDEDQEFTLVRTTGGTGEFDLTAAEIVLQLATLSGAAPTAAQSKLTITSDTTGATSSIQVQATSTAATALGFDNDLHSGADGAEKEPWKAEMIGPGAYGDGAKMYIYDSPLNPGEAVNVRITCPGMQGEEYFRELTRNPDSPQFWKNNINAHSDLVKIVDVDTPNAAPYDWPAVNASGYTFAGGDDGTLVLTDADWLGDAAGKTGLYCTDHWQMPYIDLMIFGTSSEVVQAGLHTFVGNRKGRIGYMPTPAGLNEEETVAWRMGDPTAGYSHAAFNSWEAAVLRGRLDVYDTKNNEKASITALPFLAASICKADEAVGRHRSPFGVKFGAIPGVLGIDDNPVEDAAGADLLAEYQVNNARILRTTLEHRGWEGAVNWGGWTLQRALSALRELPVARKIKEWEWLLHPIGLQFINAPNHPVTWKEVHHILDPMLRHDLANYAIYGYVLVTDKDAYFTSGGELKGAVLNTGRDIDQGVYRCRILLQPVRQIFYFVFELGVMRTGEPFANYATMYALPGWVRKAA